MSEGPKLPRAQALPVAQRICDALAPACSFSQVCGSLRRGEPYVGDIEIVCTPHFDTDIFEQPQATSARLQETINTLIDAGTLEYDLVKKRNGKRQKRFLVPELNGIGLDLFITQEANRGNIVAIRTGDKDFSPLLVMARDQGGLMPRGLQQRDGFLWRGDVLIPCLTEADFFQALGLPADIPLDQRTRDGGLRLSPTGEAARLLRVLADLRIPLRVRPGGAGQGTEIAICDPGKLAAPILREELVDQSGVVLDLLSRYDRARGERCGPLTGCTTWPDAVTGLIDWLGIRMGAVLPDVFYIEAQQMRAVWDTRQLMQEKGKGH